MSQQAKRIGTLTYERCKMLCGAKQCKRIAHNTDVNREWNGEYTVRFHGTSILTFRANGDVVLSSGGFKTVTTKQRLNALSPVRVRQTKGEWHVINPHEEPSRSIPFVDGMVVNTEMDRIREQDRGADVLSHLA